MSGEYSNNDNMYIAAVNLELPHVLLRKFENDYVYFAEILSEDYKNYTMDNIDADVIYDKGEIHELSKDYVFRGYIDYIGSIISSIFTNEDENEDEDKEYNEEYEKFISIEDNSNEESQLCDRTVVGKSDINIDEVNSIDELIKWRILDSPFGKFVYEELVKRNSTNSLNEDISVYYSILSQKMTGMINCFGVINSVNFDYLNDAIKYNIHWRESLNSILTEDEQKVEQMKKVDNILSKVKSNILISNFVITSHSKRYHLKGIDDGISIFDKTIPSLFVPHIKYVDEEGNAYHKIYTGDSINKEHDPNYKKTIIDFEKYNDPNTIYLNIWYGNLGEKYYDSKDILFNVAIFDLTKETLIVKSNNDVILSRVRDALPNLKIEDGEEIKLSGYFDVLNLEIDDVSFLNMILNDEILNKHFFVDESKVPIGVRKRITYNLMDGGIYNKKNLSFFITHEKASMDKSYGENMRGSQILNSVIHRDTFKIRTGMSYVKIRIVKSASEKIVNSFLNIFKSLMSYYQNHKQNIIDEYIRVAPYTESLFVTHDEDEIEVRKINALQDAYPEVFAGDTRYATACPVDRQPVIVSDDDMEVLDSERTYRLDKVIGNYDVGEHVNLYCDSEQYPYAGLAQRRKDTRIAPCCYSSQNTFEKEKKTDVKSYVLKTNNVLNKGSLGELPLDLSKLLSNYYKHIGNPVRLGITTSPNSLIHAVLLAIDDEKYLSTYDKEEYVRNIRKRLNIQLSLIKQELYDLSDERIKEALYDEDLFFDPYLFYRALEETYNINIYVLLKNELEIPRHKELHARPLRKDRSTVIIYKNQTGKYPHCELITFANLSRDPQTLLKLFDENITVFCHDMLMKSLKTITLNTSSINRAYQNIYYYFDLLEDVPQEILSQRIDENGKLRVIDILYNNVKMSLIIAPSQPENIKQKSINDELYSVTRKMAKSLLGEPKMKGNYGWWFSMGDVQNFIYVKISDMNEENLPFEDDPVIISNFSEVNTLRKMKRDVSLVKELVSWIYLKTNLNYIDFANKYLEVEVRNVDSSMYYDFSNLERLLPQSGDVSELISIMNKRIPTLFSKNKILMCSKAFKDRLKDYLKSIVETNNIYLDSYFASIDDYSPVKYGKLFLNSEDLKIWLSDIESQHHKIRTELVQDDFTKTPFLYNSPNGKVYIVQGTTGGTLIEALHVARIWNDYNVNSGPDPVVEMNVLPGYLIYNISPKKDLQLAVNASAHDGSHLDILFYGNKLNAGNTLQKDQYCALLRVV